MAYIRVTVQQSDVRIAQTVTGLQGPRGLQGVAGAPGPAGAVILPDEWDNPPDFNLIFDNALL